MKKSLLVLASIAAAVSMNASAATVNGGTVRFQGEVVDAACSVVSDSVDQTVILDQVKSSIFTQAAQEAGQRKPFQITLADCEVGTTPGDVTLTFNGTTEADPTIMTNTAGAGSAVGVGLRMFDHVGQMVELNTGISTTGMPLVDGTMVLPFSVDYVSTLASVTPGPVAAVATFQVTYP